MNDRLISKDYFNHSSLHVATEQRITNQMWKEKCKTNLIQLYLPVHYSQLDILID